MSELAFKELVELCKAEDLSFNNLRQKLEASPENTIRLNHGGNTLLHYACFNKAVNLDIVRYLVELYPEAVEQVADYGWLPLHRACINKYCQRSVIEYLVSLYPDALRISWSVCGLPLHCLVARMEYETDDETGDCIHSGVNGVTLDMSLVQFLVEACPDSLTNQDNTDGYTPLILACKRDDVSLELVQTLVDEDGMALRLMCNHQSMRPFHYIFYERKCPPPETVQFFLENSPDALDLRDTMSSRTPFLLACSTKDVSVEVLELFVERRLQLLQQRDRFQSLPLHILCLEHSSDEVLFSAVKLLIKKYPEAVRLSNQFRFLPLTYACSRSLEVVKLLVDEYPESVTHVDFDGHLPFHKTCRSGSIATVEYLFDLHPDAISIADRYGELPLHCVFGNGHGKDTLAKVQLLTKRYPIALKHRGINAELPLHRVFAASGKELLIVKTLFELYPEAIHNRNSQGHLPLHCFCASGIIWKEGLQFLVTQLPYGIRAVDLDGRLPAHLIFEKNYWLKVDHLKYLFDLHPDAVKVESPKHGLPIHYACKKNAKLELVEYLVSLYPESLDVYNAAVGFPLECACSGKRDVFTYLLCKRYDTVKCFLHVILHDSRLKNKVAVAKRFVDHFPGNTREKDSNGAYALHVAATTVSDTALIDKLVEAYPEAAEAQNAQGWLPLHYALRHGAPREVVECLLRHNPAGAATADYLGCIPLHVACRHGAAPPVIDLVLAAFPLGVRELDRHGCTPLHAACRHGSSLQAVKSLVNADESILHLKDERLEMPIHKACRGGHTALVQFLAEKHMPSTGMRNSLGILPVFLLSQSSGKKRRHSAETADRDVSDLIETIWRLLKLHPDCLQTS